MIKALLMLFIASASLVGHAFAQFGDVNELLVKLQSATNTDAAFKELDVLSKNDVRYRAVLGKQLPSLMAEATDDEVLANDSRLAGELKLEECIPELIRLYLRGDERGGMVTLSMITHLANDPAGQALVQIGDPAVQATRKIMESQQEDVRAKAIRVLVNIGSPSAKAALKEQRAKEESPRLQRLIDSHLAQ